MSKYDDKKVAETVNNLTLTAQMFTDYQCLRECVKKDVMPMVEYMRELERRLAIYERATSEFDTLLAGLKTQKKL